MRLPRVAWRIASLLLPGCGMKATLRVSGHYGVRVARGLAACFATTTEMRHESDDFSFWTLRAPLVRRIWVAGSEGRGETERSEVNPTLSASLCSGGHRNTLDELISSPPPGESKQRHHAH